MSDYYEKNQEMKAVLTKLVSQLYEPSRREQRSIHIDFSENIWKNNSCQIYVTEDPENKKTYHFQQNLFNVL